MERAVPNGRATKAMAKMANAIKVPSRRDRKGNRNDGKTSTQAIPKTKKSKYSDERPMITPTAISPGVTSSSVWAREREAALSCPYTGYAMEPLLIPMLLGSRHMHGTVLHASPSVNKCAFTDIGRQKPSRHINHGRFHPGASPWF
jgi:hypothetical protein